MFLPPHDLILAASPAVDLELQVGLTDSEQRHLVREHAFDLQHDRVERAAREHPALGTARVEFDGLTATVEQRGPSLELREIEGNGRIVLRKGP